MQLTHIVVGKGCFGAVGHAMSADECQRTIELDEGGRGRCKTNKRNKTREDAPGARRVGRASSGYSLLSPATIVRSFDSFENRNAILSCKTDTPEHSIGVKKVKILPREHAKVILAPQEYHDNRQQTTMPLCCMHDIRSAQTEASQW